MPEGKKVNSIVRAVNVLQVISEGHNQLTEISKKLQLGKATVHRILKTLEETGLVKQNPVARTYFLGPLIVRLSSTAMAAHQYLNYCTFDEMKRLRDFSRETVNLQIRSGLERICLEEVESQEALKYTSVKGAIQPIQVGSAGKLLMAELDDRELHALLDHISFKRVCTNTIVGKEAMLEEIAQIRKNGYAVSFSERIKGSASISVPIRNYVCPVALSVLGPVDRFKPDLMKKCRGEMLKSAETISNLLLTKGG